ncbi:unnamed protein product [Oppiella nova]|uniref:Uncharacterized protein n=1 Tax=Oppiella nova TaxID=334625 RepID=A0A7R9M3B6_9ACAR|nr:unnamed protein product [Oppiella nova]CAG2169788.1 unnamed protein product [Oppiella nova]
MSLTLLVFNHFNGISTLENVGCLFSDELCDDLEVCLDDNAFGRCERVEDLNDGQTIATYQHSLNDKTLRLLEIEMQRLYVSGYRWDNEYTQCVIKQILYTHRLRIDYDPGLCSRLLHLSSSLIAPETSIELNRKTPDREMASIEFIPDYETDFAKEIFLGLNDRNHDKNAYHFDSKRRMENKVEIDDKVFEFLKKLIEQQIHSKGGAGSLESPDHKIAVLETDLSSDLTQQPVYSEGGVEWLPIDGEDSVVAMNTDYNNIDDNRLLSDVGKSILQSDSLFTGGDVDSDDTPLVLEPIHGDRGRLSYHCSHFMPLYRGLI